jgi:hypothetical protein
MIKLEKSKPILRRKPNETKNSKVRVRINTLKGEGGEKEEGVAGRNTSVNSKINMRESVTSLGCGSDYDYYHDSGNETDGGSGGGGDGGMRPMVVVVAVVMVE